MALNVGATFAGYRILRLLGSGGMGEVYLAEHPRLPRRDAVKILSPAVSADPSFTDRFHREADLAATLFHPHIVGVHDRGESEGQLWIAFDFVDGPDAAGLMRSRYPAGMPPAEALEILRAVASALDYAHGRGLLHRDVKPANILLTDAAAGERRILLADFGIARLLDEISGLTATNTALGTVNYAAPEQLADTGIDSRADQYSLAATAFHLLTGTPPYQHSSPAVTISRHLNAPPPIPGALQADLSVFDPAIAVAMAQDPEQAAARLIESIRQALPFQLAAKVQEAMPAQTAPTQAAGAGTQAAGTLAAGAPQAANGASVTPQQAPVLTPQQADEALRDALRLL
ncbi:MAG: serine/threonine protein kinase, partial [Mycobacterium sp.]|nr:serine/threonine protein kinase [Mycobacterium sp.]